MKSHLYTKTLVALVVAVATAVAVVSQAQEQPMPPPAGTAALPPNIDPASPVAQVIKLAQAGVEAGVIRNYIVNCPGTFNLDAEKIVELNDVGIPTDLVNAMLDHDKSISAPAPVPAVVTAPPPPASSPETAPPQDVTVNYFYDTLTPYGSWVDIEGYGRCWRPTTVIYDSTWQPYCDRGHWVYSDCGWYWNSDYSWGATFHYGRWFHHARYGWCWWPDTVWAPSWVTWRSGGDYCGWAPLPPFTVYRPGVGFFYRGAGVAVGFDFGLAANSFIFVSPDHFCDRHPRYYRAEPQRVPEIFRRTTVINNFNVNNRIIVNGGIPVDRFAAAAHRSIQPVHVGEIPNAARQGWHGNVAGGNSQLRHEPNNNAPAIRQPERSQPLQTPNRNFTTPAHPQSPAQPGKPIGSREEPSRNLAPAASAGGHNPQPINSVHPAVTQPVQSSPVVSHPAPVASVSGNQTRNYSGATVRSQPQTAPVLNSPRNSMPAAPVMSDRWQQHSEARPTPVVTTPPAPAQSQSRSSGYEKDKPTH